MTESRDTHGVEITNIGAIEGVHDVVLNTLNRRHGVYNFADSPFEKTVSSWDGISVVYAQKHPDLALFEKDPKAALSLVGGRIVGRIKNPEIVTKGKKRLRAKLEFLNKDDEKILDSGDVSLSTGFWCPVGNDGTLYGSVVPNHVLLFHEVNVPGGLPRDLGAAILNKTDGVTMPDTGVPPASPTGSQGSDGGGQGDTVTEFKSILERLYALFSKIAGSEQQNPQQNQQNQQVGGNIPPMTAGVTNMADATEIAGLKVAITNKDAEIGTLKTKVEEQATAITNKDAEIKRLSEVVAAHNKEKADAEWTEIKNMLPLGETHTPEQEAELRKEFEASPVTFAKKMLAIKNKPDKKESGKTDLGIAPGDTDVDATRKAWNSALGRVM